MTERGRLIETMKKNQVGTENGHKVLAETIWLPRVFEAMADSILGIGAIVPPCKVGDTVWVNWENYKSVKETRPVKVYALRFDTKKNNMRICVEGDFEISSYGGSYTHYYNGTFAWSSVGKTVFLTREEAEKALAERREG